MAKTDTLVTIYTVGGFGASTVRAKLGEIKEVANGNGRKAVIYTPKGKRKAEQMSSRTLLVVLGHDTPDAPKGLVKTEDSERSRYGSFDPRYHTDFNKWARENVISRLPAGHILVNQREEEGETDPTIDRL